MLPPAYIKKLLPILAILLVISYSVYVLFIFHRLEQNIRKFAFTRIALWVKQSLNATIVAVGMYSFLVLYQQRQRMLLFFCAESPA
jgi:preprotein translocase subunit SecF